MTVAVVSLALSLSITISSACCLLLSDSNMRWLHCSMTNVCKKNKEKLCRTAKSCKFKVFLLSLLLLLLYVCTWQSAFFHAPFSAPSFFLASCLILSPSKFGSTVCYRLPVVAFQTVSDTSWKEIEKGNKRRGEREKEKCCGSHWRVAHRLFNVFVVVVEGIRCCFYEATQVQWNLISIAIWFRKCNGRKKHVEEKKKPRKIVGRCHASRKAHENAVFL